MNRKEHQPTDTYITHSMKEVRLSEEVAETTVLEPTVFVEHREKGPVVKEHIHQHEREEIQPIIHREREKTEVVQMTRPIREREVQATVVEKRTLPAETKPTIVQENSQFERDYNANVNRYKSSVDVDPVEHETIEKPAIIHEHLTRRVIEEVQPVILKDVTVPTLIKEVQPIYEKIIEAPVLVEGGELPVEERMMGSSHREYYRGEGSTEYREYSTTVPATYVEERPYYASTTYATEKHHPVATTTTTYVHGEKPHAMPTSLPQQNVPHRG